MKVLVRAMSLTVIGLCVCLILMHLLDYNVRLDELNKASHLAMANTQIVMQENIEDIYYNTNNSRVKIGSNEEYLKLFKDNFMILVNSDGTYSISGYSDVYKGLLCVNISHEYKNFLGQDKTITKKMINVIDVVCDNGENNKNIVDQHLMFNCYSP